MSEWPALEENFYRCPNTGEWVYRWSDERLVLVSAESERVRRQLADVVRCSLDLCDVRDGDCSCPDITLLDALRASDALDGKQET